MSGPPPNIPHRLLSPLRPSAARRQGTGLPRVGPRSAGALSLLCRGLLGGSWQRPALFLAQMTPSSHTERFSRLENTQIANTEWQQRLVGLGGRGQADRHRQGLRKCRGPRRPQGRAGSWSKPSSRQRGGMISRGQRARLRVGARGAREGLRGGLVSPWGPGAAHSPGSPRPANSLGPDPQCHDSRGMKTDTRQFTWSRDLGSPFS